MLSAKDVVKAHKVLSGVVVNTPLEYDHYLSEKYGAQLNLYLNLEGDIPEGASLTDYVDFTSLPKNVYVVVRGENGELDSNGFQAE